MAVTEGWAAGRARLEEVVAALAGARLLVPVLAHEVPDGAVGVDGEREADTGVVALRTPDGRTALPVFSGVAALAAWRRDARPVPAQAPRAAASALAEGWSLLVLDPAGPVTVLVPRPAVQALAAGLEWTPAVRDGVVRPEVAEAIVRVVGASSQVRFVRVEAGERSEVTVVVGIAPGLDRAGLSAVLDEVNSRLAADPMVAQADTLELRPVAAS
ncbi:SseB family protein [Actinotalea sp.]|uniref:SseB family protein n=1 Tax=Actinotalea sp. TaxID=1872145 RepID=UPI0035688C4A